MTLGGHVWIGSLVALAASVHVLRLMLQSQRR
jgi:hypothetical protein